MDAVLAWLLDPVEPAVRARTLVEILGRAPDDPEVQEARKEIGARGAAARLIEGLAVLPEDGGALYVPKYGAAFHRVVTLAEMGVRAGDDPRVARALDRLLSAFAKRDGGFGNPLRDGPGHLCVTGNLARAAILMGRGGDPRVQAAVDWLVRAQLPDGGWHCWPEEFPEGTLDAWEPLGAFAALAPEARSPRVRETVGRGVEFLLARGLGVGDAYAPWGRLHFPRHYYYDVLVGADLVTSLGGAGDARLARALALIEQARGADGRWRVEANHPDIGNGTDYTPHRAGFPEPVTPLAVDEVGAPSPWITLAALRVLKRARER